MTSPQRKLLASLGLAALLATSAADARAAGVVDSVRDALAGAVAGGNLLLACALALAGGLLVALTPCVYPMIAITVSVFGAKQASRGKALALSACFVLGVAAIFTPLGIVAGLTGGLMGSVMQSAWVLLAEAALFVLMAASMLGAFNLTLPGALNNRLAQMGGLGYRGAFLLGLACGPIAAPCTGPPLTLILGLIAESGNVGLGAALMAAFSLGLGAPFLLVGAFAMQLPKSGLWMLRVKSVMALVMLAVAVYFVEKAFPAAFAFVSASPWFVGGAALAAVVGLALGAVHLDFDAPSVGAKVRKGAGLLLAVGGAMLALFGATKRPVEAWPLCTADRSEPPCWTPMPVEEAQRVAQGAGRPLLVDFGAEWCAACKELDRHTFTTADPGVVSAAARFVAVRVDMTHDDDATEALGERFGVRGLPTVLLYDSTGKEVQRFTDFVTPAELGAALRAVN